MKKKKESNCRCLIFRNTLNNLGDAMKSPLARFKKNDLKTLHLRYIHNKRSNNATSQQ